MKITITNNGEYKLKIMQRGVASGNPDSADYDNDIKETFVEPGQSVEVEGKFSVTEYTPSGELPAYLELGHLGGYFFYDA